MYDNAQGVAIIGAGLSGLSAATTLTDAGLRVSIFERLNTAGGRLGSIEHADMGAQYFTARHPAFRQVSRAWQSKGWVAEWSPRLYLHDCEQGLRPSPDNIQRLVALPSMSALANRLQEGLQLYHADIDRLQQTADGNWLLWAADGNQHGPFNAVIIATTAQTTRALLTIAPQLQQDMAMMHMLPCWSVELQFSQPLPTLVDACFVKEGPLDWLARNSSKPQRQGNESWLLQSTSAWADQHKDCTPDQVTAELRQAMAKIMGLELPIPSSSHAHYWPDARPAEQVKWGALAVTRLNLYVCGDWCLGGRIENAWLSGQQAAKALLDK